MSFEHLNPDIMVEGKFDEDLHEDILMETVDQMIDEDEEVDKEILQGRGDGELVDIIDDEEDDDDNEEDDDEDEGYDDDEDEDDDDEEDEKCEKCGKNPCVCDDDDEDDYDEEDNDDDDDDEEEYKD